MIDTLEALAISTRPYHNDEEKIHRHFFSEDELLARSTLSADEFKSFVSRHGLVRPVLLEGEVHDMIPQVYEHFFIQVPEEELLNLYPLKENPLDAPVVLLGDWLTYLHTLVQETNPYRKTPSNNTPSFFGLENVGEQARFMFADALKAVYAGELVAGEHQPLVLPATRRVTYVEPKTEVDTHPKGVIKGDTLDFLYTRQQHTILSREEQTTWIRDLHAARAAFKSEIAYRPDEFRKLLKMYIDGSSVDKARWFGRPRERHIPEVVAQANALMSELHAEHHALVAGTIPAFFDEVYIRPTFVIENYKKFHPLARLAGFRTKSLRDSFAEHNVKLVYSVARKYSYDRSFTADIIQEGFFGLIRAIDLFSLDRQDGLKGGIKFSTYATHWIKQAVNRTRNELMRNIRLPVHVVELMHKMIAVDADMLRKEDRRPTIQEYVNATDKSPATIKSVLELRSDTLSLDASLSEDGGTWHDLTPDQNPGPEAQLSDESGLQEFYRVLDETPLTEQERTILLLRYGLNGRDPLTLEEVGVQFGLTRERIRQIQVVAVDKIKRHVNWDSGLSIDLKV